MRHPYTTYMAYEQGALCPSAAACLAAWVATWLYTLRRLDAEVRVRSALTCPHLLLRPPAAAPRPSCLLLGRGGA